MEKFTLLWLVGLQKRHFERSGLGQLTRGQFVRLFFSSPSPRHSIVFFDSVEQNFLGVLQGQPHVNTNTPLQRPVHSDTAREGHPGRKQLPFRCKKTRSGAGIVAKHGHATQPSCFTLAHGELQRTASVAQPPSTLRARQRRGVQEFDEDACESCWEQKCGNQDDRKRCPRKRRVDEAPQF